MKETYYCIDSVYNKNTFLIEFSYIQLLYMKISTHEYVVNHFNAPS